MYYNHLEQFTSDKSKTGELWRRYVTKIPTNELIKLVRYDQLASDGTVSTNELKTREVKQSMKLEVLLLTNSYDYYLRVR